MTQPAVATAVASGERQNTQPLKLSDDPTTKTLVEGFTKRELIFNNEKI